MKLNKISVIAIASTLLVGCVDLDTEPMGSTVTENQKLATLDENPERAEAGVNGITTMFSIYMNGNPGYENHNDFGYPSVMLFTDSRGTDLVSEDIGYNWFSAGLDFTDRNYKAFATENIWNTLYNQIYTANLVANSVDSLSADPTMQFYAAQAYAIRAFDYFNLAQLYQFTYKGNEDKPCVPLILNWNSDQIASEGCARATVQQVYDQIMLDLNVAVSLLESAEANNFKRADKRYVNLAVAKGLRARVELVMNNWDAAYADAMDVINSGEAKLNGIDECKKPTFSDSSEQNWLWGIIIAETDRVVTSGIVNWPSHMGSLNYGYASVGAWRMISKKLYNSIPSTDVRKGWWLNGNKVSSNLSKEQQAYVTSEAKCPAYTQVKFAPYKDEIYTSTNANDIPLMRIEEMYLIAAEAMCMGANGSDPVSAINFLASQFIVPCRDKAFAPSVASQEDAMNIIWQQRRIELWGEGISWFDIMRLKKGVDRRGTGFEPDLVFNIDASDPILIYQIPEREIEGNPMLSEENNNANCETPVPVPDE